MLTISIAVAHEAYLSLSGSWRLPYAVIYCVRMVKGDGLPIDETGFQDLSLHENNCVLPDYIRLLCPVV